METILEQIHKAGLKFLAPLTLDETYRTVASEAIKLVKADYASIYLDIDGSLERVYTSSSKIIKSQIRHNGNTYKAFKAKTPTVISEETLHKIHPELVQIGIKSKILIPLTYKDKPIGVLSVQSKKSEFFTNKELRILKLFGSMVSLALRKSQLYGETKKALELRDLFISIASHELRTPLTSLNGYIQLLYNRLGTKDTPEANWTKELYAESKRLTSLVSELLEINRIKQGQLQFIFRECHMGEVVANALERFSFMELENDLHFTNTLKPGEDMIVGDFDKLLQVVSNLISNALKFSPEKSEISILLTANKNMIMLQVIDHGEGIDPSDLPKIFEEFYKGANSLREQKEGLGIGLILAKHIVAAHKGTIELRSEKKKGTIVEVNLPRIK